jgi:hypothetical protein
VEIKSGVVSGSKRDDKSGGLEAPKAGPNLIVLLLLRVIGIGVETANMLVKEILSRNMRDRRAVACYGGLTKAARRGSPDPTMLGCGGERYNSSSSSSRRIAPWPNGLNPTPRAPAP